MSTTPASGVPHTPLVESKQHEPAPADRGAALLARHIEATQEWGASPQASLTRALTDLIALAEEDPDLSFADALAEAWRRLD